ncbi:MAG TPA: hypothetical protein VE029_12340, partial [Rhizobacter sp.]|nr:hypothetical protein [Rhizobacter sp.]
LAVVVGTGALYYTVFKSQRDENASAQANLQKTGYFRNIEIKESIQDEQIKDMQAFQFTLTCEKAKS